MLPGQAARVVLGVPDSAAYTGNGYTIRGDRSDRFGNRRGEPVGYAALVPSIASVDTNGVVTAHAIGRAGIEVSAVGIAWDTAWITVPPQGTMAAYDYSPTLDGQPARLVMVSLDGTGLRTIVNGLEQPSDGSSLAWAHDGSAVLFWRPEGGVARLFLADSTGATRRAVPGGSLYGEMWGAYSRDGRWLFFNGPGGCAPLYRARGDGSVVTQIGPTACAEAGLRPSPTPDGARALVWHSTNGIGDLDVASGRITWRVPQIIGPSTVYPARWSPDGSRFLFARDTTLWLATADGAPPVLVPLDVGYAPLSVDWSPDGVWLLAKQNATIDVIRLGDNLRLPLPFAVHMTGAAWRPEPSP